MGTRSTTKIYEKRKDEQKPTFLFGMYKQFDGYTSGWGTELKDFLRRCRFVNGFGELPKDIVTCNGVNDFVLLLVKEFKEGTGNLYLTGEGDSQEYNYVITFVYSKDFTIPTKIIFECLEEPEFDETFEV